MVPLCAVVFVVAEDSTDVVVSPFLDVATLFNWSTPAWVNCASCCDVRIKGFEGGGGSEKLNFYMLNKKGIFPIFKDVKLDVSNRCGAKSPHQCTTYVLSVFSFGLNSANLTWQN